MAKVSDTEKGGWVTSLVNLNCCELIAQRTDRYALTALRDAVHSTIVESTQIPIRNYEVGGQPVVGNIVVNAVSDRELADGFGINDNGIAIWNLSATTQHLESYT